MYLLKYSVFQPLCLRLAVCGQGLRDCLVGTRVLESGGWGHLAASPAFCPWAQDCPGDSYCLWDSGHLRQDTHASMASHMAGILADSMVEVVPERECLPPHGN